MIAVDVSHGSVIFIFLSGMNMRLKGQMYSAFSGFYNIPFNNIPIVQLMKRLSEKSFE